MSTRPIDHFAHSHVFLGENHDRNHRRTLTVVGLTLVMMVAEITGGIMYGSMALLADGWHMSTHAAAIGIATFAYSYARKHAHDARFTFGTGKIGELAGFASAIILAMVALFIGYESVVRLYSPVAINFTEATWIAVVGLGVNLVSAWLLFDDHDHDHGHHHEHSHDHDHHHHGDSNLRGAYLHVIADAMTSVLAIFALLAGRYYGWAWLDPAIGIVGAAVILKWSYSLLRTTGSVLADMVPSDSLRKRISERVEVDGDQITDLHVWTLGPGHTGVILSVVSAKPVSPGVYKNRLRDIDGISHITIEVCPV